MPDMLRAAYDATPYESKPVATSHLDNLATIARLHGLRPPAPEHCRVLELGCASGGNLLPMAVEYPASTFVGVDLSPRQVKDGQATIRALGFGNVRLETRSILDIGEADGLFDYVICHGVYSWVPRDVQDAILRVCADRLSANGIAYVSYNTYPGWHARMMARQMMMANDDPTLPPMERVARARAFVREIAARAQQLPGVHGAVLRAELGVLDKQSDSHLLHEQLEEFNEPILFSEFARRASAVGLRHLADAGAPDCRWPDPDEPPDLTEEARIRQEQVVDFTAGRTFRRSVLVRRDVPVDVAAAPGVIRDLHVVLRAVRVPPTDAPDEQAPGVELFRSPEGTRMGTASPVLQAALQVLEAAHPASVAFQDLELAVANVPGDDPARARLPATLLGLARAGMVDLRSCTSRFTTRIGDKPVTTALARWQGRHGPSVADLRHWSIALPPLSLFVLHFLDGTHTPAQLVDETERALRDGRLTVEHMPTRSELEAVVDDALRAIATSALLLA